MLTNQKTESSLKTDLVLSVLLMATKKLPSPQTNPANQKGLGIF
jgi:translation elongation factor EF-G